MSKDNEIYITGDVVYTKPELTKIPGIRLSTDNECYFLSFGLLDGGNAHKQLTYAQLLTLRDSVDYLLEKGHQKNLISDLDDAQNTRTN